MGQNYLNEQISVLAKFDRGQITPLCFKIKKRLIRIDSIDLRYKYRQDNVNFHSFSVSAAGNSYKLSYNCLTLEWFLEEIFTD